MQAQSSGSEEVQMHNYGVLKDSSMMDPKVYEDSKSDTAAVLL